MSTQPTPPEGHEPVMPKIAARFWAKVKKGSPDECWEWLSTKNYKGYGVFQIGRRQFRAHRISFQIANGRALNKLGCHKCDNPACVNPGHIFDGSVRDNTMDCMAKGRYPSREVKRAARPNKKLCPESVRAILASTETGRVLARRFNVSEWSIRAIKKGLLWNLN